MSPKNYIGVNTETQTTDSSKSHDLSRARLFILIGAPLLLRNLVYPIYYVSATLRAKFSRSGELDG